MIAKYGECYLRVIILWFTRCMDGGRYRRRERHITHEIIFDIVCARHMGVRAA